MRKIIPSLINTIPRPWLIRLSYLFMQITAFAYGGNRYECPVCGGRFRKLLPYGYNKLRSNALCPRCFSLERHRLMWLFLKHNTRFFTDQLEVLHVAPEQCFLKRFRKMNNLKYTTADLESPLADVRLDIQDMPFERESFDVVICNHVLEHVPDDRQAMREILRVLRPGGFAILQVPTNYDNGETLEDLTISDPKERERLFRQKDHWRLYGRDYISRLKEAGFETRADNFLFACTESDRKRFALPGMEYMYGYYKPDVLNN